MKIAISIVLALAIGGGCRYFDIPVPAPPTLIGVLLIACITAGYMFVNLLLK
ncbi:MAG: XapX domain-containing protein [Ignavibacteriota bacterium]